MTERTRKPTKRKPNTTPTRPRPLPPAPTQLVRCARCTFAFDAGWVEHLRTLTGSSCPMCHIAVVEERITRARGMLMQVDAARLLQTLNAQAGLPTYD